MHGPDDDPRRSTWKQTVARRFDAAAASYEGAASVQGAIALELCEQVLALPLAPSPRVLEVGCGTGFLTRAMHPRLPGCRWIATDLSPRMVERCALRLDPRIALRVMDGEWPDLPEGRFDLVVSSMAVQWFEDVVAGLRRLRRLLGPGGWLAVTTLGSDTFEEWRRLRREAGFEPAAARYPGRESLERELGAEATVHKRAWELSFPDLRGFLVHLRRTGARAAAPGRPPLPAGVLRGLVRRGQGKPFVVTLDVLTVVLHRAS